MAVPRLDRLQQLPDSLPLIAARFEVGFKLKWHPLILAQHRQQRRTWLYWRAFAEIGFQKSQTSRKIAFSSYALSIRNVSSITDWPRSVYGSGRLFEAASR